MSDAYSAVDQHDVVATSVVGAVTSSVTLGWVSTMDSQPRCEQDGEIQINDQHRERGDGTPVPRSVAVLQWPRPVPPRLENHQFKHHSTSVMPSTKRWVVRPVERPIVASREATSLSPPLPVKLLGGAEGFSGCRWIIVTRVPTCKDLEPQKAVAIVRQPCAPDDVITESLERKTAFKGNDAHFRSPLRPGACFWGHTPVLRVRHELIQAGMLSGVPPGSDG